MVIRTDLRPLLASPSRTMYHLVSFGRSICYLHVPSGTGTVLCLLARLEKGVLSFLKRMGKIRNTLMVMEPTPAGLDAKAKHSKDTLSLMK